MHHQLTGRASERRRASVPREVEQYEIRVTELDGTEQTFGSYDVRANLFAEIEWVGESVGYQIFPERFAEGNPDLNEHALETDSYHYKHPDYWEWPAEPFLEDDWYGEATGLHCCHQCFGGDIEGIIDNLDYLEDLGVTLPYLNPILESGERVHAGNPDDYDSWWNTGNLPKLETRHDEVFEHLIDVARHWAEFGFDGARIDVPNEIVNREGFFGALRQELRTVDPDHYIVGEIRGRDASWLQGDQFGSLMNYAVGQQAVERFAAGAADDNTAAALLYALPGTPITYVGDEMGFLGEGEGPEEENRFALQWDDIHQPTREHYQKLGELKHSIEAFDSAVIRDFDAWYSILSFMRGEPDSEGEMLALFNNPLQNAKIVELPAGTWEDAASREEHPGTIDVKPTRWRYLVRQ